MLAALPAPPEPQAVGEIYDAADVRAAVNATRNLVAAQKAEMGNAYAYRWSSNGDSWALITDKSQHMTFSGDWHDSTKDMIEKVRKSRA